MPPRPDPHRDQLVTALRSQGLTQRAIAAHVGLSKAGVHQVLRRLAGNPRDQRRYEPCAGWRNMTALSQLRRGLCNCCREVK